MANDYGMLGGLFNQQNQGLYNSSASQLQANSLTQHNWASNSSTSQYGGAGSIGSLYNMQNVKMYSKQELKIYHLLGLWGYEVNL